METIVFDNVDTNMLNMQRIALVEKLWDDEDSILWGIVEMLDDWYDREYNPDEED